MRACTLCAAGTRAELGLSVLRDPGGIVEAARALVGRLDRVLIEIGARRRAGLIPVLGAADAQSSAVAPRPRLREGLAIEGRTTGTLGVEDRGARRTNAAAAS